MEISNDICSLQQEIDYSRLMLYVLPADKQIIFLLILQNALSLHYKY